MVQTNLRHFGFVAVAVLFSLMLTSSRPNDAIARRAHGSHSGRSAHSARHHFGANRNAKLSSNTGSQTLSSSEKKQIIEKIKTLAHSHMVADDSTINAEVHSTDIQAEISQAAKEERAEDDVDVSLEQFFKARPGATESLDPKIVRERQNDYTLFDQTDPNVAAQRSDVMAQIIDWLGTRYEFGGEQRSGIDCSAFTRAVFRKAFSFDLPRTAVMQHQLGDDVKKSELAFGDLVFFRTAAYASITHVGIYIGEGLFANAACSKGVSVASLSSTYWSKHYVGAKRLFSNSTLASGGLNSEGVRTSLAQSTTSANTTN